METNSNREQPIQNVTLEQARARRQRFGNVDGPFYTMSDTSKFATPATFSEAFYKAALAEIDGMGDPAPGTLEFARLDYLVTRVEAYEALHYPISPPTAEAMAEKRGQSFEDAKEATFEQYDVALQRLAHGDRDEFIRSLEADDDPNEALVRAAQDFNQRHGDHVEIAEND